MNLLQTIEQAQSERRVLVVEDEAHNQESARRLEKLGYAVDVATNVHEALTYLGREYREVERHGAPIISEPIQSQYHAVLTDLNLPLGQGDLSRLVGYTRTQLEPLGFQLALYGAKLNVPRIAILSDTNHHTNQVAAMFDLFTPNAPMYLPDGSIARYGSRTPFAINRSKVCIFDNGDLHFELFADGSVDWSEQYIKDSYGGKGTNKLTNEELRERYPFAQSDYEHYKKTGRHVKNWSAALGILEMND